MGGAIITLTKGWANQRADSCCLSSRPGVRGLFSASCIEGSSLNARGCMWLLFHGKYYFILCESRGQWALNGPRSVLLLETAYLT